MTDNYEELYPEETVNILPENIELRELYKIEALGDMAKTLREIRDRQGEIKEVEKALNTRKEIIEKRIIEKLEEENVNSMSTEYGTLTKVTKLYPSVADYESLRDWVLETGRLDILQKRVTTTVFAEIFEETGEYPDGIDAFDKVSINFRKK